MAVLVQQCLDNYFRDSPKDKSHGFMDHYTGGTVLITHTSVDECPVSKGRTTLAVPREKVAKTRVATGHSPTQTWLTFV